MSKCFRLLLLFAIPVLFSQCSGLDRCKRPRRGAPEIVVSVADQRMALIEKGQVRAVYPISTSKFGAGDQPGSYRTPLGKHQIASMIGAGAPAGAVFKSRRFTGEVLRPNAPGRDPIVTRILWLRGCERENKNAFKRYIYIHGTPEERTIGSPASFGCIRMRSEDIIDLFNRAEVGSPVLVTQDSLNSVGG